MAEPRPHRPVLLILAAFSRHWEALDSARSTVEEAWGEVALESEQFEHRETNCYTAAMGPDLRKTFWALAALIDHHPATIPIPNEHGNATARRPHSPYLTTRLHRSTLTTQKYI
jgi:hypothetical protein